MKRRCRFPGGKRGHEKKVWSRRKTYKSKSACDRDIDDVPLLHLHAADSEWDAFLVRLAARPEEAAFGLTSAGEAALEEKLSASRYFRALRPPNEGDGGDVPSLSERFRLSRRGSGSLSASSVLTGETAALSQTSRNHESCFDPDAGTADRSDSEHNDRNNGKNGAVTALHLLLSRRAPFRCVLACLACHPAAAAVRSPRDGRTPLHAAVASGSSLAVLEQLLYVHPQAVAVRDSNGRTPFHLACQPGARRPPPGPGGGGDEMASAVAAMLELGGRYVAEALRTGDENGRTPLHRACDAYSDSVDAEDFERLAVRAADADALYAEDELLEECRDGGRRLSAASAAASMTEHTRRSRVRRRGSTRREGLIPIELLCREYAGVVESAVRSSRSEWQPSHGYGCVNASASAFGNGAVPVADLFRPVDLSGRRRGDPLKKYGDYRHLLLRGDGGAASHAHTERATRLVRDSPDLRTFHGKAWALIGAMTGRLDGGGEDDDYSCGSFLHAVLAVPPPSRPPLLVKYALFLDPRAVLRPDGDGDLPLHVAARTAARDSAAATALDADESWDPWAEDGEEGCGGGAADSFDDASSAGAVLRGATSIARRRRPRRCSSCSDRSEATTRDRFWRHENGSDLPEVVAAGASASPAAASGRCRRCRRRRASSSWRGRGSDAVIEALLLHHSRAAGVADAGGKLPLEIIAAVGGSGGGGGEATAAAYPRFGDGVGGILAAQLPALERLDLDERLYPRIMERFAFVRSRGSGGGGVDALFQILKARPSLLVQEGC